MRLSTENKSMQININNGIASSDLNRSLSINVYRFSYAVYPAQAGDSDGIPLQTKENPTRGRGRQRKINGR